MDRLRVSMLVVGVCLFFAVGVYGQRQKPATERSRDAASAISTPVVSTPIEPDSPATDSTVTASSQATSQASSQLIVPRLIKFSGVLRDVTGHPMTGPLDVTFALYNAEAGGDPLWFETQSVQADELGHYTALLGSMHTEGLPVELFTSGEAHWLGIQVGHEQEQQPRVLLVSVPYALKAGDAETLGGKPASAYMLSDSQSAGTSGSGAPSNAGTVQGGGSGNKRTKNSAGPLAVTPCTSVTSDGTATANAIAKFTTACNIQNSAIIEVGGNVGIGTPNPLRGLHIRGGSGAMLLDAGPITSDPVMFFSHDNFASPFRNYITANRFDERLDFIATNVYTATFKAGKVGIGTSTPAATLEVNGTAKFDGAVTFASGQTFPNVGIFNSTTLFNNYPSINPGYVRINGGSSATATEAYRASVMPVGCTAANLTIALSVSVPSLTVVLRDGGASTTLGCTISGGLGCTDNVHTVPITAGSLLDLQLGGGSATATVVYAGFTCQ